MLPAKIKGGWELIAFVEATNDGMKGAALEKAALDVAAEKLPYYMVPSMTHTGICSINRTS